MSPKSSSRARKKAGGGGHGVHFPQEKAIEFLLRAGLSLSRLRNAPSHQLCWTTLDGWTQLGACDQKVRSHKVLYPESPLSVDM